jgi:hypothetical protein
MVIPFIALLAVIIGIVLFASLAGKKKAEGEDLGDPNARQTNQPSHEHSVIR